MYPFVLPCFADVAHNVTLVTTAWVMVFYIIHSYIFVWSRVATVARHGGFLSFPAVQNLQTTTPIFSTMPP